MSPFRSALALLLLHAPLAWSGDARVLPSTGPVRLPAAEAKALRKALADAKLLSQDEDVKGATVMCIRWNPPPRRFYEARMSFPKEDMRSTSEARALQPLCKLLDKRFGGEREQGAAGSAFFETSELTIRGKGADLVIEHAPLEPLDGY